MELEPLGEGISVKRLKDKLKKRFPNYNFDIPAEPDTRCKVNGLCPKGKLKYLDNEGNVYCGFRFKQVDEDNIYHWWYATCNALLEKHKPKNTQEEMPF